MAMNSTPSAAAKESSFVARATRYAEKRERNLERRRKEALDKENAEAPFEVGR